jgi:hypothetical protein
MRYILKRDVFLDQNKINEVFQNEVTWGGSLLGRLINSTIRVLKLNYDAVKIEDVNTQIKATIYEILKESLDKDLRVKLYRYRIKNFVSGIRNMSLTTQFPAFDSSVDCGSGGSGTKISNLIGTDASDTRTPDFSQSSKELSSGLLYDFFQELDNLTSARDGDQDLKNVLTRQELDELRNIHSDFAVELRRLRWKKCNSGTPIGGRSINRTKKWKDKDVIRDTDAALRDEISVKNESKIFKKFSDFEAKRKLILEFADSNNSGSLAKVVNKRGEQEKNDSMTLTKPSELKPELLTDAVTNLDNILRMLKNIMAYLSNYNPSDTNLSQLVGYGIKSQIFSKWSANRNWIDELFVSDPKSLRIFLSTFIKSLYGIQFKGGEDFYEKIGKMGINETVASQSQLNKIYQERRIFISDLSVLITYFQSILSYLIGLKRSNKFDEKEHGEIYGLLKKFFSFLYNMKTQLMTGLVEGPKMTGSGGEWIEGPVKKVDTGGTDDIGGKDDTEDQPESDDNKEVDDDENKEEGSDTDSVGKLYNDLFIHGTKPEKDKDEDNKPMTEAVYPKFFGGNDISKYELTRDDLVEFKKLESELSSGKFTLTRKKASDAIIRLLNLLTTAYELFATEYIPSGRPGGRVSMKTFKEYQKLGTGDNTQRGTSTPLDAGGTSIMPNFGPWAQRKVYEKFQKAMRELLKDQELRKIFANINFSYPGSEDKFNEPNESMRYKIVNENAQTKERNMGPEIFMLLEDLITPNKCGDGLLLISNVKRKYFGLEPLKSPKTPGNAASNSENDDTVYKTLRFQEAPITSPKLYGHWAFSIQNAAVDFTKVQDALNPYSLNEVSPRSTLVFLSELDTKKVKEITTTLGSSTLDFYPVKITFKTPLVANEIYKKKITSCDRYCDLSDNAKLDPTLYYGYYFLKGDTLCLFYVNYKDDPITKIDFQKVTLSKDKHLNRGNPDGEKPPKPGSFTLKAAQLRNNNSAIIMYENSVKNEDRAAYDTIFEREVFGVSGRPKFMDYIKSILETSPVNDPRLIELRK